MCSCVAIYVPVYLCSYIIYMPFLRTNLQKHACTMWHICASIVTHHVMLSKGEQRNLSLLLPCTVGITSFEVGENSNSVPSESNHNKPNATLAVIRNWTCVCYWHHSTPRAHTNQCHTHIDGSQRILEAWNQVTVMDYSRLTGMFPSEIVFTASQFHHLEGNESILMMRCAQSA